MTNKKISTLPEQTGPLDGSEILAIVKDNLNKKVTLDHLLSKASLISENKDVDALLDYNGLPDYNIPLTNTMNIKHIGQYYKVVELGVSTDLGMGVDVYDFEVCSFKGVLDITALFGGDFTNLTNCEYFYTKISQGGTVLTQAISFKTADDIACGEIFYEFNKISGVAAHRVRTEHKDNSDYPININSVSIDNIGTVTANLPTTTAQTHWYQSIFSLNNFSLTLIKLSLSELVIRVDSYFNGANPTVNDLSSDFGVKIDGVGVGFTIAKFGTKTYDITIPFSNVDFIGKGNGTYSILIEGNGTLPLENQGVIVTNGTAFDKLYYLERGNAFVDTPTGFPIYTRVTPTEAIAPVMGVGGKRADLQTTIALISNQDLPIKVTPSCDDLAEINLFPNVVFNGKKPQQAFQKDYGVYCNFGVGVSVYVKVVVFYEIKGEIL